MYDHPRLLIFIVAYNAERHIEKVLHRIPKQTLEKYDYEILIIDDQSKDKTFERALHYQKQNLNLNLTVLYNPKNQGYGGNQKLGYHYAQLHHFDIVLLLHGDGQYAPEEFDRLVVPIAEGKADAVFGSRMLNKQDALKGKMPYYKFVGNIILTQLQNRILGTHLSEFHSGYRAYSVAALSKLPIERNSNDFHFDTQIIIQLVMARMKIVEVPIPTHYGDEVCYVNGTKYAYNIIKASIHSQLQQFGIYYKREYDLDTMDTPYRLKSGYLSSHTRVIQKIPEGSRVLDIGDSSGLISMELLKKGCSVTGIDSKSTLYPERFTNYLISNLPALPVTTALDEYDVILLMDVLETVDNPEKILDQLREAIKLSDPDIYMLTANVGFFITRFQLLFGGFNYGKRGILDLNHKRLYTRKSIQRLCEQSGFKVIRIEGLPAPYPEAFGLNLFSRMMVWVNAMLVRIMSGLFSYEYLLQVKSTPVVKNLIKHSIKASEIRKQKQILS